MRIILHNYIILYIDIHIQTGDRLQNLVGLPGVYTSLLTMMAHKRTAMIVPLFRGLLDSLRANRNSVRVASRLVMEKYDLSRV